MVCSCSLYADVRLDAVFLKPYVYGDDSLHHGCLMLINQTQFRLQAKSGWTCGIAVRTVDSELRYYPLVVSDGIDDKDREGLSMRPLKFKALALLLVKQQDEEGMTIWLMDTMLNKTGNIPLPKGCSTEIAFFIEPLKAMHSGEEDTSYVIWLNGRILTSFRTLDEWLPNSAYSEPESNP